MKDDQSASPICQSRGINGNAKWIIETHRGSSSKYKVESETRANAPTMMMGSAVIITLQLIVRDIAPRAEYRNDGT
jgi:hypothetical protein